MVLSTEQGKQVRLEKVLVAPMIAKNIISVGKLERAGNEVQFKNRVLTISRSTTDQLEIPRDIHGPMYHLKATRVGPASINAVSGPKELDINKAHELC